MEVSLDWEDCTARNMDTVDSYRYIGIIPANGNHEDGTREEATGKYLQRVRQVLRRTGSGRSTPAGLQMPRWDNKLRKGKRSQWHQDKKTPYMEGFTPNPAVRFWSQLDSKKTGYIWLKPVLRSSSVVSWSKPKVWTVGQGSKRGSELDMANWLNLKTGTQCGLWILNQKVDGKSGSI